MIYLSIISSAILFGIGEFIKGISTKSIDKSLFTSSYFLLSFILNIILYLIIDKTFIKTIPNINLFSIFLIILCSLVNIIGTYFYFNAFQKNNKLKNPYNVGILNSILALYFIITMIADIIYKLYTKQKINISIREIIGVIFIILGVILISTK
mgnify:CR=1 FL=1|jgi:drug/metabolite transporter (DMT)-like permease